MAAAELLVRDRYLDSAVPDGQGPLLSLRQSMTDYYRTRPYHAQWIAGINANWQPGAHDAQLALCARLLPGSRVLEVGCGDGRCAAELTARVPGLRYVGLDLNPDAWKDRTGFEFVQGSADSLPFPDASFDAVVSMFVLEHLVFPRVFLDEAWRVLRPNGRMLTVAPDFLTVPMSSERIGLSYGAGRQKLGRGRLLDALLTAYDTRLRIPRLRRRRRDRLARGEWWFPVLARPRCLRLPEFTPDCDAVYPACPEEVMNYLRLKPDCGTLEVFFRGPSAFGLLAVKAMPSPEAQLP